MMSVGFNEKIGMVFNIFWYVLWGIFFIVFWIIILCEGSE